MGNSTFKFLFRRFPTGFEVSPKMRLSCKTSRSLRLRPLKSSMARLAWRLGTLQTTAVHTTKRISKMSSILKISLLNADPEEKKTFSFTNYGLVIQKITLSTRFVKIDGEGFFSNTIIEWLKHQTIWKIGSWVRKMTSILLNTEDAHFWRTKWVRLSVKWALLSVGFHESSVQSS